MLIMEKIFMLLIFLVLIPNLFAIKIDVKELSSEYVMIKDLQNPAIVNLRVTNNGPSDEFRFYNLLGFNMEPVTRISIYSGTSEIVQLKIYPKKQMNVDGFFTFNYFIQGKGGSEISKNFLLRIVSLKDSFEIGAEEINPNSNTLKFYFKNLENFDFGKVNAEFSSPFFTLNEEFEVSAKSKNIFEVNLEKEDFNKLLAGYYTINAKIKVGEKTENVEGMIRFVEKDLIETTSKESGFLITKKIIKKENEGNTIESSETIVKKNILSRLFTSFNTEPEITERQGLSVYYTWSRKINPGETLEIIITTNWLLPFVVVALVIFIFLFVKNYNEKDISLRKKVTFVKTKSGDFALKISILASAKKYVENVVITDRLPALVKVYPRFGMDKPSKVEEHKKLIEWNFDKLEAGETRILSYIIYSKVGVMGKFALPSTIAVYEREGEIKETESNKAFFISEQRMKET